MIRLLDPFPLWMTSVLTIVFGLACFEIGRRPGRLSARRKGAQSLSTLVGASLGLLAFFLAFTFGLAASRFDARRRLVLAEANAIGTAYLRADLIAERHRSEVRRLLREYADVRIEAVRTRKLEQGAERSLELQALFWS